MKPRLILIRGPPASGKTTPAKELAKKLGGKIALLMVDEFRWIMTAHKNRDSKDFKVSFKNYLSALENYLKLRYTVISEDTWIKKQKDKSTDINKVLKLAKKCNTDIHQFLLKGSRENIKRINTLRPMVIPQKELKELYNKVYSWKIKDEYVINIDNKDIKLILKEVLQTIDQN